MNRRLAPRPVLVLIVEDEELVRGMVADTLEASGFRVIEAQNADEAFELLKARPDVRAIFTDVDMPGSLDGFEFARLVHQGWPEVGVLVASGKTAPGPGDLPAHGTFMAKPFRGETLVEQMRIIARENADPRHA